MGKKAGRPKRYSPSELQGLLKEHGAAAFNASGGKINATTFSQYLKSQGIDVSNQIIGRYLKEDIKKFKETLLDQQSNRLRRDDEIRHGHFDPVEFYEIHKAQRYCGMLIVGQEINELRKENTKLNIEIKESKSLVQALNRDLQSVKNEDRTKATMAKMAELESQIKKIKQENKLIKKAMAKAPKMIKDQLLKDMEFVREWKLLGGDPPEVNDLLYTNSFLSEKEYESAPMDVIEKSLEIENGALPTLDDIWVEDTEDDA